MLLAVVILHPATEGILLSAVDSVSAINHKASLQRNSFNLIPRCVVRETTRRGQVNSRV